MNVNGRQQLDIRNIKSMFLTGTKILYWRAEALHLELSVSISKWQRYCGEGLNRSFKDQPQFLEIPLRLCLKVH